MKHRASVLVVIGLLLLGLPQRGVPQALQGVDARWKFPSAAARVQGRTVPNLAQLRGVEGVTPPVPGGLGAGTVYLRGALTANRRAELSTKMIVYPGGISVPNWLFTTATNRTELTVEVVGIYLGTGASLGVFDWSCQPEFPCPNGSSGASWQWTRDLVTLPCYFTVGDDGGGHTHDLMSYRNESIRRGDGVDLPPNVANWRNSVQLLNHCTGEWETVYRHDFHAAQRDCSADQFACGWWGPIIETFNDSPQPPIPELGFLETTLRHDNEVSLLGPSETFMSAPWVPWTLFHLDPNRSWGAGSYTPE